MALLESILDMVAKSVSASKPVIRNVGEATVKHIKNNSKTYAAVMGGAVVAGGAYAYGKAKGHTEGKKEGTAEQAKRDEEKFRKQHEAHERDRKEWKEKRDEYEDLLNDLDN